LESTSVSTIILTRQGAVNSEKGHGSTGGENSSSKLYIVYRGGGANFRHKEKVYSTVELGDNTYKSVIVVLAIVQLN
jgi:hypothetical protein